MFGGHRPLRASRGAGGASSLTRIPLVDLGYQHREIAEEIEVAISGVIERCAFILGDAVSAFERDFALFSGVAHCVGVASGTDALELALRAVGVGVGDEVVLPTNSFVATAMSVVRIGAVPVLVDCEPAHLLIDIGQVVDRIGPRTRAVVPVHLYGQMAPVDELAKIASEKGVAVVEDAAQAQGALRPGRGIGSFSAAAATSFYPGKNLGAYGDAGAVLTDRLELASRLRRLGNYGSDAKYHHSEIGFNSRLDTVQAVVLAAKLTRLAEWNALRAEAARRYDALLDDVANVVTPKVLSGNEAVWHLYVVRVPNRDAVLSRLRASGIEAGIHYPIPIHRQRAFEGVSIPPHGFPVAERVATEVLSLPIYPGITFEQQQRVIATLREAIA